MLDVVNRRFFLLYSRLRGSLPRRRKTRLVVKKRQGRPMSREEEADGHHNREAEAEADQIIRVATFNAAMFSMAPAAAATGRPPPANDRPKSILKQRSHGRPKLRVSINLPDNEISAERSRSRFDRGKAPMFPAAHSSSGRSVMDVLTEAGADIVALQNVKAEEEKGMKPLSDLAEGLGMEYVFAESWAPEYGNAVLSKWPIKRWRVQRIVDDTDYRNVLKATIDVPHAGEVNFYCTYLDHFDESWRMKQVNKILQSSDGPHILAGGLNSLDETDYSPERWADIVKYYEEIGKPTPRAEVMKFLRGKQYLDAKNFAGECESVVVVAKGQDVQGTCKYGTRVDYILTSPNSPYKFVPRSYMVLSSKGTSDHHIVRVDVQLAGADKNGGRSKPKVVKMGKEDPAVRGIWTTSR